MTLQKSLFTTLFLVASSALAQSTKPVILDGDYRVELKIGSNVFQDQMTLQGKEKPIEIAGFDGDIAGTMTVPGMFTSPLEGIGVCTSQDQTCRLQFTIEANENGGTYKVKYTAVLGPENFTKASGGETPVTLTGAASLEDGTLLGEFVATKQAL